MIGATSTMLGTNHTRVGAARTVLGPPALSMTLHFKQMLEMVQSEFALAYPSASLGCGMINSTYLSRLLHIVLSH